MTAKLWKPQDNSMPAAKALLRRRYLPENASVLDCFCGSGEMYQLAYVGRVKSYLGLDKQNIHAPKLCMLINNLSYLAGSDLSIFNTFDLDDYGSPWRQFYLILKREKPRPITVYMTDGLIIHQKLTGGITHFVSGTERIPRKWNIPGLNRWYIDIFATMLLDVKQRFGWQTDKAVYFANDRETVYYWALKML
ncbi:hypothetical protein MUP77_14960 [Candidatus Bathyarchaeota archaeon]|nr:hypothetical protein [Candidatus Bathyarchaeota archaeon]